jgi:2-oxoglutarate ferredoxin oxidoreductase subunit alpha
MLNFKLAGLAGEGIAVTGTIFSKLCMRQGLKVFAYGEYPSLIRGGHNTVQVTADPEQVTAQQRELDVLVALNVDGIKLHLGELTQRSITLVDKTHTKLEWDKITIPGLVVDLPMQAISMEIMGSGLAANVVAIGLACYLLGLDLEILKQLIKESFARKGEEVVAKDQTAAERGYKFGEAQKLPRKSLSSTKPEGQILVSGNEAIGLGALAGGLQFYAAYPMTPASSLLEFLADQQANYPLIVKHAEDEISAINQAIGASYAGVRAMVGTSGGGFALMVEGTSLAAITEVPLVVMEGQRPGPATGLPTWTCQADLQFVLHAGHGEFGRVVLAPGDMQEAFSLTRLALMVAEQWQTQVYILTDKYLLESAQSIPRPPERFTNNRYSMVAGDLPGDNSYERYQITPAGYSLRSVPGQPHGLQLTNSYEHDEHGYATEEAEMTKAQTDKRLRKLNNVLQFLPAPYLIGPAKAEVTFVSWGSTKLPIQEVVRQMKGQANAIQLTTMAPFPGKEFSRLAKQAKRLVMVEGNATRQAERLIRESTGIKFGERINRYDGRPFYAEDLVSYVQGGRP